MFRHRRTSQKPNEELYANFKQSFPDVGPSTSSSEAAPAQRSTSLSDALTDASIPHRHFGDTDELKDHDSTPKGLHDQWRFTPSLMDPNSFAFASFANQPPGYYTPTPGGINTLYHSQAGDLHTPGMGMNVGTPLSLPASGGALPADSAIDMHQFHPQLLQAHQFHNVNPFAPQQSFAPSTFMHHDSGYGAMEHSGEASPEDNMGLTHDRESMPGQAISRRLDGSMIPASMPVGEKFRYHVTLNAPTAMIKHADEIPVTYLNKGQAYSMSVVDTMPMAPSPAPVRYRTFVRVSFEDEQQRSRPSACWQLWKEGRGTNEAHQRGGKLLAVEHVDPNQGGDDETRRPQIELESASFDGFCVTWTPNPATGTPDCSISVRFNFLSTDFSHSKGVKGIPVRLCAKTEMLDPTTSGSMPIGESEVCYCKVKLFRDHGAERKLSNDVAHVKKTIDKLKQQITQAETGIGNFGKRKRSSSIAGKPASSNRPGKVLKHKRTWSMESQDDSSGRMSAEEDLHMKLATMQDMFSSTRPVSVLYLKGQDQDDPDLFPVQLTGEPQDLTKLDTLTRQSTWESRPSADTTPVTSNLVSPTASSNSINSPNRSADRRQSGFQQPVPFNPTRHSSLDWPNVQPTGPESRIPSSQGMSPEQPIKVQKIPSEESGALSGWIDALGVDTMYQPPPERPIKPIACFYVLVRLPAKGPGDDCYRAVYLMQRSVKDLINGIAEKWEIDPNRVTRTLRINPRGLKIVVDEDVVRELPEGQDMLVEFSDLHYDHPVKHEWDSGPPDIQVGGPIGIVEDASFSGLEMKLIY